MFHKKQKLTLKKIWKSPWMNLNNELMKNIYTQKIPSQSEYIYVEQIQSVFFLLLSGKEKCVNRKSGRNYSYIFFDSFENGSLHFYYYIVCDSESMYILSQFHSVVCRTLFTIFRCVFSIRRSNGNGHNSINEVKSLLLAMWKNFSLLLNCRIRHKYKQNTK